MFHCNTNLTIVYSYKKNNGIAKAHTLLCVKCNNIITSDFVQGIGVYSDEVYYISYMNCQLLKFGA